MSKTLQARYIEALIQKGEREVKRSTKHIVFSRKEGGFYYIGYHGSLRVGENKASSILAHQLIKNRLLAMTSS